MKIFLTLFIISSLLFGGSFFRNQNYVVDQNNNMMWQDTNDNITLLQSQSKAIDYCENLTLDGYSNWHLPSRDEYKNIIDMSRKKEELMINRKFEYVLSDQYWTCDNTWRNFGLWAYYIYFKSGTFYYENKTYPKYVRCVRDMK